MKKILSKTYYFVTALVVSASAVFFCCAFQRRLPVGTTVNGINVGRMTLYSAKEKLREDTITTLKEKRLRIYAGEQVYEYVYPEVNFTDCFSDTLASIKKRGEYFSPVNYYLCGVDEIADYLCNDNNKAVKEPYCVFNLSGEPFTYYDGVNGISCDRQKLLEDIAASLNGDFCDVRLKSYTVKPQGTLNQVKADTKLLYTFTTYFDGSNTGRAANIRLAASKINGTVLGEGKTFSFNSTVGARTADNGFKRAKIIENGKFVQGYGGGVCQVSTTLYNAAILSGLEIEEYHPHSLQVSYVAPSRDAMVSGSYFDLKFKNNRKTPIYIRVNCTFSSITCSVYGKSDGYTYEFRSDIKGAVPRPPCVTVEGEEDAVLSYGRDGLISEGILVRKKDGKESTAVIRKDKYLPVADVIQVKSGKAQGGETTPPAA